MTGSTPAPGEAPAPRGGLTYVLGATVVAGAIGYVIQAVVPGFITAQEYVAFGVFWSVVYLVVSALSGIQQELARASHSGDGSGWPVFRTFALVCAAGAAVLVAVTSPLWAARVFPSDTLTLVAALAFAALGYALVAAVSGALYGVRNWPGVAGMTVSDAALRLIAVIVALVAGAGLTALGWAVAVPFLAAAVIVWAFTGRSVVRSLALDADLRGLGRNSVRTVGAAIATGLMISGLPFLLGVTVQEDASATLLASLILVITLTRAPLIIPLLALQSYLIVSFRDAGHRVGRRVAVWGGGLAALTAVLALAAAFVGPWLIDLLYSGRYELPPGAYAAIVASAGLTGLLCITGPAVLSEGRHTAYLAGWAAASVVTVACLLVPLGPLERVLLSLLAGPVVGVVVHAVALARGSRVSG